MSTIANTAKQNLISHDPHENVKKVAVASYPLQELFFVVGVLFGIFVFSISFSLLAALSVFSVFLMAGILWESKIPPVLPFCIFYQWLFVVTGYFYNLVYGYYPSITGVGSIDKALLLSIIGLFAVTIGIRFALFIGKPKPGTRLYHTHNKDVRYNINYLFWIVILLFTMSWITSGPLSLSGAHTSGISQIISRIFEFRNIFFAMLILSILKQRKGYAYGGIAFVYSWLPNFTSELSSFSKLPMLVLVIVLAEWKPWSASMFERLRSWRIISSATGLIVALFILGLVWQAAIKPVWRSMLREGEVQGSQTEILSEFKDVVSEAAPQLVFRDAIETFAGRLSSDMAYFSMVLDRVPRIIPYENGYLSMRAVKHICMPRILFPNKENLGGDSWLIERYAGLSVAGNEEGTSIGLGYIPEFYIDFGSIFMFFPAIVYGLFIGFVYIIIQYTSPSYLFHVSAIATIFLSHFLYYGSEIAKLLGGMLQSLMIFAAIFLFAGKLMHQTLLEKGSSTNKR